MTVKKVILCLATAFVLGFFMGLSGVPASVAAERQVVAGFLEEITIGKEALQFKAKLDTGAQHSLLNASDIRLFKRNGVSHVSFVVTDSTGKTLHLEHKTSRIAQVKMRNETYQARPVILLSICLGPIHKEVEVNLVDRSFFDYQVLIGRSYLAGSVLVDAGAQYLHNPKSCRKGGRP